MHSRGATFSEISEDLSITEDEVKKLMDME